MSQQSTNQANQPSRQNPILDYYPATDDGYSLQAYYQPNPRIHGPIRIKYRPTHILERATLLEVRNTTNEKTFSVYLSQWMEKRILGWSIKIVNEHGEFSPMPVTTANILMLKPPLWKRMVDTVCWGFDGGDDDPEAPKPDNLSDAERDLKAMLAKAGVVDAQVEELEKN